MLEPGISDEIIKQLQALGHMISPYSFGNHGGGQGIVFDTITKGMFGGSDPRKDGMAVAW
jgi:gamma-glutamyltranspeptidase/glutathione hydrolase